jgi:hypothetical protein
MTSWSEPVRISSAIDSSIIVSEFRGPVITRSIVLGHFPEYLGLVTVPGCYTRINYIRTCYTQLLTKLQCYKRVTHEVTHCHDRVTHEVT